MRGRLASIRRRDALAAVAVIALGVFGIVEALGYRLGELRNIGPGTFPLIVSALIVASGVLIGAESLAPPPPAETDDPANDPPRYRVLLFVTAGLLSFAVLTPIAGAVPGIVACVFLTAYADGSLSLWRIALLAAAVAAFCAVVFVQLLNLPLNLVEW